MTATDQDPQQSPATVLDLYVAAAISGLVARPESSDYLRPDKVDQLARIAFAIGETALAERSKHV